MKKAEEGRDEEDREEDEEEEDDEDKEDEEEPFARTGGGGSRSREARWAPEAWSPLAVVAP